MIWQKLIRTPCDLQKNTSDKCSSSFACLNEQKVQAVAQVEWMDGFQNKEHNPCLKIFTMCIIGSSSMPPLSGDSCLKIVGGNKKRPQKGNNEKLKISKARLIDVQNFTELL